MAVQLRAMNQDDTGKGFILTQQLKWPHRLADWQQALRLGEGIVAEKDGELVGTILCWRWGERYATLGLVIVADNAQGQGVGKMLMLAALEKLAGCHIRLHATAAGIALYEKLGFVTVGNLEQRQCPELGAIIALAPQPGQRLRDALPEDAECLTAVDYQAHGLYRPRLIEELLVSAQQVLVLEQAGTICGFAAVRHFGHGYIIGPVIARHLPDAKLLVSQLLSHLNGQFVRIDTDTASDLGKWLSAQGIVRADTSAIMIKGTLWQPDSVEMQVFGLMSQAMA